jgi:Uma2 family endonuclease
MPPREILWTANQFHNLGDRGVFEGRRAALINGIIIEEGPMSVPHRIALELTENALRTVFDTGWRVCVRMPLVLSEMTDPEPDVSVISGSPRGSSGHPTTAALVVEVADLSLSFDITTKADVYAVGSIADYWVLDLTNRRLLIFRDPQPIAAGGISYHTQLTLGPADTAAPLAAPASPVRVTDLLP